MNTNPIANCRAGFERLIQEFASAANDAPIFHQRLSGPPGQLLVKRTWEDFSLANYFPSERLKRGQWQVWMPHPDGLVCSRFVGSGDKSALDRFRRLADAGMALLRAAALAPESATHFDASILGQIESAATDETYLGWVDAVHLTAKQCRTLVLDVKIGNWAYTRSPHETDEKVASAMSAPTEAGLVAFPIHPIVESLQDDVFRSSAEAIKVWLDAGDMARVGNWPEQPPIYLPRVVCERQQDAGEQEGHAPPAVVDSGEQHEQSTTSVQPTLLIDRETFSVSYGKVSKQWNNTKPFLLLERLNNRPGAAVPISSLRTAVWQNVRTTDAAIKRQVSLLRRKLADDKFTGIAIDGESVRGHFKLILTDPTSNP
jgi:hypothetical protein